MRKKLLVGNWKMNKTRAEALSFATASIELSKFASEKNVEIGVTPTYLSLDVVNKTNPNLIVGAQNVHTNPIKITQLPSFRRLETSME